MTKPCHPEELIARVEAVARRRRRSEPPASAEPVTAGEVEVRADQFQAFVGDRSVDLTRREFELIQLLADAEGRVLEREEIYQRVWGYAMARGDRSVDVFVRKLRQKLEKASPGWRYIHTHFGVGYRFAPELAESMVPEIERRRAVPAALARGAARVATTLPWRERRHGTQHRDHRRPCGGRRVRARRRRGRGPHLAAVERGLHGGHRADPRAAVPAVPHRHLRAGRPLAARAVRLGRRADRDARGVEPAVRHAARARWRGSRSWAGRPTRCTSSGGSTARTRCTSCSRSVATL